MGGFRGGGAGCPDHPGKNHKWLKVSLGILVWTPIEKQLDPWGRYVRVALEYYE